MIRARHLGQGRGRGRHGGVRKPPRREPESSVARRAVEPGPRAKEPRRGRASPPRKWCGGVGRRGTRRSSQGGGEEGGGWQGAHDLQNIRGARLGLKKADEGFRRDAIEHAGEKFGDAFGMAGHDAEEDAVHPGEERGFVGDGRIGTMVLRPVLSHGFAGALDAGESVAGGRADGAAGGAPGDDAVEYIIELDKNNDKYIDVLKQTWFENNIIPDNNKEENIKSFLYKIFE